MGRAGRGGGGIRAGGGRSGGGLGGGRSGSSRIGGTALGGRAGRGQGGIGRAPVAPSPPRVATPRVSVAPRPRAGFGTGMAVGMGLGMGMGRPRRRFGFGGFGFGRRRGMGHGSGMGAGGGGCGTILLIAAVLFFIIVAIGFFGNLAMPFVGGGSFQTITVEPSTIRREALPRSAANDVGPLFTDTMNPPWIGNATPLNNGLRSFFNRTGVRPHVYLFDNINGNTTLPTVQQMQDLANDIYDELFIDEAHVLLLFFENSAGQTHMYVLPGSQARSVMDDEARNILMDFVDRYYYSDLDEATLFGRAFEGAGQRIMSVTRSQWIPVLVVAGILLLVFLLFKWWQKKQEQKNLEAEQTERILSQDLTTFGDSAVTDEASRLAQQYQDDENNS